MLDARRGVDLSCALTDRQTPSIYAQADRQTPSLYAQTKRHTQSIYGRYDPNFLRQEVWGYLSRMKLSMFTFVQIQRLRESLVQALRHNVSLISPLVRKHFGSYGACVYNDMRLRGLGFRV